MSTTKDPRRIVWGRMGILTAMARNDVRTMTKPGRDAAFAKFLDQIPTDLPEDERRRRAKYLERAHLSRIALKSVETRRRRQKAA